jgi:hypothetical protein
LLLSLLPLPLLVLLRLLPLLSLLLLLMLLLPRRRIILGRHAATTVATTTVAISGEVDPLRLGRVASALVAVVPSVRGAFVQACFEPARGVGFTRDTHMQERRRH